MFRRAITEDIPSIENLLGQVLKVHHDGRPDLFKEVGVKYTAERLAEMIEDDNKPIFVYEEDGRVLAHCFCQIEDRAETSATYARKTLFIDDLCVDEEARGRHIGKKTYEALKIWALTRGFDGITLHVWECNPAAIAFYKSLGMQVQQYTMEELL